jgi:hypothetical protein
MFGNVSEPRVLRLDGKCGMYGGKDEKFIEFNGVTFGGG